MKLPLCSHFTLTSFHNSILLCDVDVAIYADMRISRCQKRCSDGKPFYYIAHSDINNTLGNFLFKDKILQQRFLKNSKHWTFAKSLFSFSNQFLAFQSAFFM